MSMIPVSAVRVVDRHRTNHGDLSDLVDSMRQLGQLQPIVVTPDLRLIAGERRLTAARSLGWAEIEAKIAHDITDAAALLRAERDENTCRKAFTPTEEHSLYEALLALQMAVTDGQYSAKGKPSHFDGTAAGPSGRVRESVAEIVSGSAGRYKTLDKIGQIKRIANEEGRSERVRQVAAEALTEMDRTGNISGPHMRVQLAVKAEAARNSSDFTSWPEEEQAILKELRARRTVVVSFRDHHANLVRWAQAGGLLVAVDRRTEWGNPFEMPYDGDRETVIQNYAQHYLPYKPSLLDRVSELRGKALACWCAPEPCHADILKKWADEE
jgi:Domain of unknown function (DUF4326)/ParB-like nuclease domain